MLGVAVAVGLTIGVLLPCDLVVECVVESGLLQDNRMKHSATKMVTSRDFLNADGSTRKKYVFNRTSFIDRDQRDRMHCIVNRVDDPICFYCVVSRRKAELLLTDSL
jgi:hypothetical protein